MDKNQLMKKIVDGEYTLFLAIRNGHKTYIGDKYQEIRTEIELCRCLYYGEDSKFCKKNRK